MEAGRWELLNTEDYQKYTNVPEEYKGKFTPTTSRVFVLKKIA